MSTSQTVAGAGVAAAGRLPDDFVDEAPAPRLARLERPDDGVGGVGIVPGGVPAWRGVAAADVPALQAQPQVYPVGSALGPAAQALLLGQLILVPYALLSRRASRWRR